ncbi:hypothetical protein QE152_g11444 [Popillia japonica]|uniref:Uncharacterized protein n=1 Tax=Popillia japonica TaxID=7064 RepID=A0AAW1LKS1_POPJA
MLRGPVNGPIAPGMLACLAYRFTDNQECGVLYSNERSRRDYAGCVVAMKVDTISFNLESVVKRNFRRDYAGCVVAMKVDTKKVIPVDIISRLGYCCAP